MAAVAKATMEGMKAATTSRRQDIRITGAMIKAVADIKDTARRGMAGLMGPQVTVRGMGSSSAARMADTAGTAAMTTRQRCMGGMVHRLQLRVDTMPSSRLHTTDMGLPLMGQLLRTEPPPTEVLLPTVQLQHTELLPMEQRRQLRRMAQLRLLLRLERTARTRTRTRRTTAPAGVAPTTAAQQRATTRTRDEAGGSLRGQCAQAGWRLRRLQGFPVPLLPGR
mmetsp:Transcript_43112/g.90232  ORF Transcript_43112/g.90232 Transcript_43112/m.90232 type:complete len:223 (+) Transcript_43112:1015-1683(+)